MNNQMLIERMPKAELHLHIEGTLEPELMMSLARRNGVSLPLKTIEDIRRSYDFSCLQDFLDIYYLGMSVLIEREDFRDLAFAYLERAHAQNVTHAEIFFDPQGHTDRGVPFDTVISGLMEALEKGQRELKLSSKLIMCFLRHLPEEAAMETLRQALPFKRDIHAVGLDSGERGNPPEKFERVFEAARQQGYLTVAHAGEEGPAEYIRSALDVLHVSRVDHGNRVTDDDALLARIAEEKIPLTMCPLSNLKLKVIDDLRQYPLRRLLEAGVVATINSDDPAYFGGYVNENYLAVSDALGLSRAEVETLARNSFSASFLSDAGKRRALDEFDAFSRRVFS